MVKYKIILIISSVQIVLFYYCKLEVKTYYCIYELFKIKWVDN